MNLATSLNLYQHFGIELFGTFLLVLLGNGVVANVLLKNTKGNGSGWIAISAGWGFAVMIGALCSSVLGGAAQLNPAVTIANVIGTSWFHDHGWLALPVILSAQFIGAFLAQIVVDIFYWKTH